MNVALTRAKCSVFILGNAATLERSDEDWRSIVHDARNRSLLTDVSYHRTSDVKFELTCLEVDVTYFTSAGTGPVKTVPARRAPSKTIPVPGPPLPELSTPQQLAAVSQRDAASRGTQTVDPTAQPASAVATVTPSPMNSVPAIPVLSLASSPLLANSPVSDPQAGQKRPVGSGDVGGPDPKRRPPPDGQPRPSSKPKLPPVREKKKPSIFMPSKVRTAQSRQIIKHAEST
jgi:senataxin